MGLLALAGASAAPAPLRGVWVERGPLTTFRFEPCGTATCGVLLDSPYIKADANARDVNNPDPNVRDRTLKGLTVIRGLHRRRAAWSGQVYLPSQGKTFPVTLRPVGGRTLAMSICLTPTDCHGVTLDRRDD